MATTKVAARRSEVAPSSLPPPVGEAAALAECAPVVEAMTRAAAAGQRVADVDGDGRVTTLYPAEVRDAVRAAGVVNLSRIPNASVELLFERYRSRLRLVDGAFVMAPAEPAVLRPPTNDLNPQQKPRDAALLVLSEIRASLRDGRAHLLDAAGADAPATEERVARRAQVGWEGGQTPQGHPIGEVETEGSPRVRLWVWHAADLLADRLSAVAPYLSPVQAVRELAPFADRLVLAIDADDALAVTPRGGRAPEPPLSVRELVRGLNAALSAGIVSIADASDARTLGSVWGVVGRQRPNSTVVLDSHMAFLAALSRYPRVVKVGHYSIDRDGPWDAVAAAAAVRSLTDLERYGVALMLAQDGSLELRPYAD